MDDVAKILQDRIKFTRESLAELEDAATLLAAGKCKYKVVIHSAWADYGEKTVKIIDDSLEDAKKKAVQKFKRINDRTDVQGHASIFAVFENGVEILLKQNDWYWRSREGADE